MFVFVVQPSAIQPVNGDPFVGMLETPITSTPEVASYLSNLPAYRTGVAPLLRGVEIGLAHGFFLPGPFIKVRRQPCMASAAAVTAAATSAALGTSAQCCSCNTHDRCKQMREVQFVRSKRMSSRQLQSGRQDGP
jgi:hypothetical protein